jgi:hypothetical protein
MLLYKINFPVTDDIFAYNFLVSYIDIAVKLKWQCEMTMDLCFVKQPQNIRRTLWILCYCTG